MIYINGLNETFLDFPDDSSIAVIVFFEGCDHNCRGCQNFSLAKRTEDHAQTLTCSLEAIEKACRKSNTTKIVFSGGDPFYEKGENDENLLHMLRLISMLQIEGYEICIYTGNDLEDVLDIYYRYKNLLSDRDNDIRFAYPLYLKTGFYNESLKDDRRGKRDDEFVLASYNQAFYKFNYEKGAYDQISEDNILRF